MTDFAPPMISRTYERVAKALVSLRERKPFTFAVFRLVEAQNARTANSGRLPDSCGRRRSESVAPKRRRKPLKSLKTESEMAPGRLAVEGKESRPGDLRISP
jgi:hypothetical protein